MGFGANKTPVEVIRAGAFGGTYFRNIYYSVSGKRYKKSRKEFDQLKDIDWNFIVQILMILVLIYMVLNAEHRQDFGKIKVGLMK